MSVIDDAFDEFEENRRKSVAGLDHRFESQAYLMWFLDRISMAGENERYQLDVITIHDDGNEASFHYRYWLFGNDSGWDVQVRVCSRKWDDVKQYIEKSALVV